MKRIRYSRQFLLRGFFGIHLQ